MDKLAHSEPDLRTRLIEAQFTFNRADSHAIVILISGYASADVEDAINRLNGWMDPRNIRVYALDERETGGAQGGIEHHPPRWWFWRRMPARGQIAIFYDGWYHDALDPEGEDHLKKIGKRHVDCLCRFEAMLEAEGVTVLKVWLDRSPANLKRRIQDLEGDPATRWQVTARDRARHKAGARYRNAVRRLFRRCEAPVWHSVDMAASDTAFDALGGLVLKAVETPPKAADVPAPAGNLHGRTPKEVDFHKDWQVSNYKRKLRHWQGEVRHLTRSAGFKARSLVILFEGFDAAGKGGTIRRLTRAIDPRQRAVVPISAPTEEELRYPYLWRFWRHIPAKGDVTIFDRSWYGRVLVERVEGLTPEADWRRAYQEIRDYEAALTDHGVVLIKFWLALSPDEQLRRFKSREADPHKRYKITADDWRNFEKHDAYLDAVRDMFTETDTGNAPWTLVVSEDKQYARVTVLKTIARKLRAALG